MKLPFLTLLLLWTIQLDAQQYDFKVYNDENGLSTNHVYDVLQSRDNRLWLATRDGIQVFDGQQFEFIKKHDGLASNNLLEIFEDSKGRIWIGSSDEGFSVIENNIINTPKEFSDQKYGAVNAFAELPNGSIAIFYNQAIILFNQNSYELLYEAKTPEGGLYIVDAQVKDENTIIGASTQKGIVTINLNPFAVSYINQQSHAINNICYSVHLEGDTTWVGSFGVLYKFVDGVKTEYVPDWDKIDKCRIWGIQPYGTNKLALAYEGNGFSFFNKETTTFESITEANGLPSSFFYQIIQDNEQNLWMASYDAGLVRYRDNAFIYITEEDGLISNEVNDVLAINNSWLVATDKGLQTFTDKLPTSEVSMPGTYIGIVKASTAADYLVQSYGKEYAAFDHKNGKYNELAEGHFFNIYKDDTYQFLATGDTLKVRSADTTFNLPFKRYFDINPFGEGYLITARTGLHLFQDNRIDTLPKLPPGVYNNWESSTSYSPNEVFALGSDSLYYLKSNNGTVFVRSWPTQHFALLENLSAIEVHHGYLWIKAHNSLSKIHIDKLITSNEVEFTYFPNETNFLTNLEGGNLLNFDDQGNILMPTNQGLLVFNETNYIQQNKPPRPALHRIDLFSEELNTADYMVENRLVLPHRKNYLTFFMEAVSLTYPERIKFKYRLKGLRGNDDWSPATHNNAAVYTYLPPGNYTFEFTADNGNNVWQQEFFTYPFKIEIPLWRRPWFIGLVLTSLMLTAFFVQNYRNRLARKRQQLFTQELISAQEDERKRLSRELHDGIAQELIHIKNKLASNSDSENEELVGNTLEDLRNVSHALHPFVLERFGLTEAVHQLTDKLETGQNLFFDVELDPVAGVFSKEQELHIYRIIQECLNNVLKYAESPTVRIAIRNQENYVNIEVRDFGKGFDINEQNNKTSLGLKTIHERSQMIPAKLEIESFIDKGTLVQLTYRKINV